MTAAVPDAAGVLAELRQWIEASWDPGLSLVRWRELLADAGWACPAWPHGWCGRSLPASLAALVTAELADAGVPGPAEGVGVGLAGPALIEHGTNMLRDRLVRRTVTGEITWCQLFSEPGAGSDLAGLTTRAEVVADGWLVTGQKVWSTGAATADFGLLLARTDASVPKHRGITCFVLPMRQPGVEARPLRQMNGYASFNEVFLDQAKVPAGYLVGEPGGGWSAALSILAHERRLAASPPGPVPAGATGRAWREAIAERTAASEPHRWYPQRAGRPDLVASRAAAHGLAGDPLVRQEIARLVELAWSARWTAERAAAARAAGRPPGPEGSLGKLASSVIARQAARVHALIAGPHGMLAGPGSPLDGTIAEIFLSVPGISIAGGTDQIQRTIIGERILGLPREPDPSRNLPFREVPGGLSRPRWRPHRAHPRRRARDQRASPGCAPGHPGHRPRTQRRPAGPVQAAHARLLAPVRSSGAGHGSPVAMTTFVFTDEQQDLRGMVRRFLAEKSPVSEIRRLMVTEAGHDPAVWAQLGRLGLAGLIIPEEYGGAGRGPVEQLIVCEEMGAALLCAPYLASAVLATWTLLACGDVAAQAALLPGMASGETIATLAVPEDDGSWAPDEFRVTARRSGDRHLLDGRKSFVLDGMIADLILVAASSDDGPVLVAVDGDALGLSRQAMQTLDMTRKQAVLTFSRTPGRLVCPPGAAAEIVAQAVRGGVLALAAEQVGGAQRCLDMAVAYAKVRHQFGRAIGSFQAVKHMCADMLLEVESARSAAYHAAWAAADGAADLPLAASLAKAYCSEAYFHVAASNIQVHGGIGFTWEHDAHLYYRRAKSAEVMLGTPASHREIVAGLLLKDSAG